MTDSRVFPPKAIPAEIDRWNWGAFLLNWIWGVGNNTFIALLTLIPLVGLIMPFVLGARGSGWAWRNGRWDGVEHFKRVQRLWAIWGAVIWIVVIVLFGGIVGSFSYLLKYSEAYQLGVSKLKASSEATYILGDPISTGIPLGAITFNGESGRAVLNFSATGSKAQGRVFVEAFKQGGVWSLRTLTLRVDGRDGVIDLLKQSSVQFESSPRARFVAGPRPQGGLVTIFGKRTFVAGEPCAAPSSPTASAGRTSTRFAITVALSRASTACVVLQAPLPCALAS